MPEALGPLASIGGALIGSDSASSAANKQADAANNATALQKAIFDTINQQQAGYRQRGDSAGNLLSNYLGLPQATATASPSTQAGAPQLTNYADLRNQLLPQFTTYTGTSGDAGGDRMQVIDEPALQAAIQQHMQQASQNNLAPTQQVQIPQNDPRFGSLLKQFTGQDLPNDPGYQFGLNQGIQALDRSAAARGRLGSGAQSNQLIRYGTDYAGTKYGEAYNRDLASKQNTYNMLSGVAGTGQVANQQTASAGMNYGNQAGQNMIGAGNARGAASIAQGNALTSGLNGLAYGLKGMNFGGSGSANDPMSWMLNSNRGMGD